jgi:hypothetical protein
MPANGTHPGELKLSDLGLDWVAKSARRLAIRCSNAVALFENR